MTFQSPPLLWALLLVPLAIVAYVAYERRRAGYATRWAKAGMAGHATGPGPGWRRHLPPLLLLLTAVSLVVALARPQAALSVPRQRATVVLVMDSSRSMRATDIDPSRLIAARRAGETLIDQLPDGVQVGVVGFARRAQTLAAPTTDRVAVRRALGSLTPGRGTAIGAGLVRALELTERPRQGGSAERVPAVLLLLSDGINTYGVDPAEAARRARAAEVPVHAVALGAPPGAALPSGPNPPDFESLQGIVRATEGTYSAAPTARGLRNVYRDLGARIGTVSERREVTVAFVGAGALFMLAAAGLSVLWFKRVP